MMLDLDELEKQADGDGTVRVSIHVLRSLQKAYDEVHALFRKIAWSDGEIETAGAVAQRCEQLQKRIAELEAELEAATYDPKAKERLQSFRFAMSQNNNRISELEAEVERLKKPQEPLSG